MEKMIIKLFLWSCLSFLIYESGYAQFYESSIGLPLNADQFRDPGKVAVDASGNVYVIDAPSKLIKKFNSSGILILQWGSYGNDNGKFLFFSSSISYGIAVDATGNVYVIDGTARIQKFTSTGVFVSNWGIYGAGDGQLNSPSGIVIDGIGNIYIVDGGNQRIQKFDSNGIFISKWGIRGSGDGQFESPNGIAIDAVNNIYVVDGGNHRIQKFDSNGIFISKWGSYGVGNSLFISPSGIAVDAVGNIYVVDRGNHRIQKFNSNGSFISKWGSRGSGDGQFDDPYGTGTDTNGNVFVVDSGNDRIQKFNSSGTFISKWGRSVDDGQFSYPEGIAADATGNIYIADSYNNRIQKFNNNGTFVSKWGSIGSGDGQFNYIRGVAVDVAGNIYVVDYHNHRIQKFDSNGTFITKWGSSGSGDGQFSYPVGITADATGNIYVVDSNNHRIQKFTSNGGFVSNWGSAGSGDGQFSNPSNIAIDAANNIYVVDGNRIQKFNSNGIFISKWDISGADNGQFISPEGIAIDLDGNQYVVDRINHRVQQFTGLKVKNVSPLSGAIGALITITGKGFSTLMNGQVVKFNGVFAEVITNTQTSLVAKIPIGATTGSISINRDGNTSESVNEIVILPLSINSILPLLPTVGSNVTISGSGFSSVPSNNVVKFNDVAASVIPAGTNATTIKVTIPVGATSGKISVTVGDVTATSVTDFKITKLAISQTSYPDFYKVGDASLPVSITVNDVNEVGSIVFKSRGITAAEESIKTEAISFSTLSNSIVYQIPAAKFTDPLGLYSWFSLLDKEGNEILTEPKHTYLNYSVTSQLPDLVFGKDARSYNMIGIPFNLTDATVKSVFKILGNYDNRKWRLYELTNGILIEEPKTIVPGKGYWLIASKEAAIQMGGGSTMKVTKDSPFKLKLNQGANLIGNPYDFTISWDDVLAHNGLTPELLKIRQYINGSVVSESSLKHYRGAYIISDVTRDIEIPIINRSLAGGRIAPVAKHSLQHEDWVVNLSLDDGDFRNELFGFGMNKKALEALDIYDDTELPLLAGMSSFDYSFRSVGSKKLISDIVPTTENYSWESSLSAGSDVTLTWNNSYFGDNEKQLVLENASDVHVIDMRSINQISLRAGTHKLKFHYGDINYIKEQLIEKESRVGYVYPNPVMRSNGVISIALSLPEGKNEVALELRNSLGVSMTALQSATYDGGRQIIHWQTNMDQLTQGVYLMRVAIKDANGASKNSYQKIILE
jgi:sugar lactone lactonase YvrE